MELSLSIFLGISLLQQSLLCSAQNVPLLAEIEALIAVFCPIKGWPPAGWPKNTTSTSASTPNPTATATASFALQPTAGTTWNIQLLAVPAPEAADDDSYHVWDFDMEGASASTIKAFHDKGRQVICYFSAGSVENYRSDADQFPADGIGKTMEGWPDEEWVDIRNDGVRDIMTKRIQSSKDKGCDGVDPDNIDGYDNDTGFPLTMQDSIDYVHFLCETAHGLGLACGVKNGGDIVEQVVDAVDWCIQEECVFYKECDLYRPYIDKNKPVFHIEYPDDRPKVGLDQFVDDSCSATDASGFSTLVKKRGLDDWTRTCS